MNRLTLPAIVLLFSLAGIAAPAAKADTIHINGNSYAAVAYSPSTGSYYYAYNHGSRYSAEQAALRGCQKPDAQIVCWVNDGFCALALGDKPGSWGIGYSWGSGANNREAIDYAVENARSRTTGAHLVLCISSDGQYIAELK